MPAYTFRSVGAIDYDTNVNPLTPGAPAGKAAGDLLLLYTVQRTAAQTLTSLAPDWVQLYFDNAVNFSIAIWARIADGAAADTPSPTWTGTTGDCAAFIEAYSGDVHTDLATIIAHGGALEVGSDLSVLRLPTLTITTANTLVIAFTVKLKSATSDDCTTITAAGGLTKRLQHIRAGAAAMMLASASAQQTTATNYDGSNFTRDGTDESLSSSGVVISLKTLSAPSVVVTDVDTDESIAAEQLNVVATGTGFGAAQGAGHVRVYDGALFVTPTIDTWAATSIQFDMSIGTSTGIRYGARTLRVTETGGAFGTLAIQVTAPAGKNYVDLTSLADPADRLSASAELVVGDQIEWSNVVGGAIGDVTVYPDASFSFVAGVTAFDFRVHDVVTGWGTIATVSIVGVVPTITTTTLPGGAVNAPYEQDVAVSGDATITWDLSAGALPGGLAQNSTSGKIDGTPTTGGTFNFTVRATNASGNDTQALSIVVDASTTVPDLTGFGNSEVAAELAAAQLVPGTVFYKIDPTNLYKVTAQAPDPAVSISIGGSVNYEVGVLGAVVSGHGRGHRR